MIERKVFCDRCGDVVIEHHSIVKAMGGLAAERFPEPLDLCESCLERFADFIRGGKQPAVLPYKMVTVTR